MITVSSVASAKPGNLGALYAAANSGTAGAYSNANFASGDTVTLQVAVTGTNGAGTATATSAPTRRIEDPDPSPGA